MLLDVVEKWAVQFLASRLERSADVLEEVDVADLHDAPWEDVLCGHADGIVLIAGHGTQRVIHVLELREELHHRLEVLRWSEETGRDVMRDVIHPVDERNLLLVAFHRDVFPIDDQGTSEALPVAVPGGDVVVARQSLQFLHQPCVRRIKTAIDACGERPDARAFEMQV